MSKRYYVTLEQIPALIRAAYDLSVPQGMGFLHARSGSLDEASVASIASRHDANMDYVHGRAIKLGLRDDGDRQHIEGDRWYDHTLTQLEQLADRVGLTLTDSEVAA